MRVTLPSAAVCPAEIRRSNLYPRSTISEKLYISLPDTCLYNEEENRKGKNVLFSKKINLFETTHSFETVTVDGGEFRGTCRKNSSYFD